MTIHARDQPEEVDSEEHLKVLKVGLCGVVGRIIECYVELLVNVPCFRVML